MSLGMRFSRLAPIGLAAVLLHGSVADLAAQERAQRGAESGREGVAHELRFADDAPSRSVVVDLPYATITVEGWPGDSVHVDLTPGAGSARSRELPPVSLADGRLVVADRGNQEMLDVRVRASHDADVSVHGSNGGPVRISGMHGNLEIENSNAGIFIEGSRSGVAASTSNGPIVATVDRTPPGAPMSFLTSNDSVRIVLPGNADAELHLETDNAVVRSEFDVGIRRPARAPAAPGHARTLRGRLGDGGAVLRVRTDNGDIILERGPSVAPPAPDGDP